MGRGGSADIIHPWEVLDHWASRELPEWSANWKTTAPRVCLAKLVSGRDIEDVNSYLRKARPVAGAGSSWLFHRGDHDFSLVPLTIILFLFGDREGVLYPKTREHLLRHLLTLSGPRGNLKVPYTLGMFRETENHILMMEGSRYLKDRWLSIHRRKEGRSDLERQGSWLSGFLKEKVRKGLEEFNSQPYIGFTLTILLALSAFGGREVSRKARGLLDVLNRTYALSSISFRRYPPFNRRRDHAGKGWVDKDPHTSMMKVWALRAGLDPGCLPYRGGFKHALMAYVLPYDLPEDVKGLLTGDAGRHLVFMGHGRSRSPEICSRGPGYLITAGGARCRRITDEVVRPITVMFDDGARHLDGIVHLGMRDRFPVRPNNTGVFHRFAVSNGPVHVPKGFKEIDRNGPWALYKHSRMDVCVHSTEELGIVALLGHDSPAIDLEDITRRNNDPKELSERFIFPDGTVVRYEPKARPGTYVIKDNDLWPGGRYTDKWPPLTIVQVPDGR